ncbi:MipA/OmpV family protein [Jiella sp. MQZ9-1]|uniref:MipA/OmpV family protein n=1 Tax=Jiella flava TaxID=2816857 RepID=A0A939FXI7_9HYPH|nr:MipA/OmpV family protein [Jiella flava]MBO0662709.1 MipA/OmpV family protein [Jiella flava]MCD2471131.1 MipA/OmpV family protein [Jiella flava]
MALRFASAVVAAILGSTTLANAADVVAPYESAPAAPQPATVDYAGADFVFELGIKGIIDPEYLGSDNYKIRPGVILSVEYLNLPGIGSFGGPDGLGFSIGPSFDYVGARKASDHPELSGLDDVDPTYQAGIKASYAWQYAEVYGSARYAFGGAKGFVGDLGANLIARPTDTLTLKLGPTASLASKSYMEDYFSVSPSESAASGGRFATYDAKGGFKSVGVAASARYEFRPDWFLNADASWDRLVGSAKDSPIVKASDKNQYSFTLGISKRFSLDLW